MLCPFYFAGEHFLPHAGFSLAIADHMPMASPALLFAEEATSVRSWITILVVIRMTVPPSPILILSLSANVPEFAIVPVPFAEIEAIRMIFAFIPCMVVMMIAVIVAVMIYARTYHDFLSSGCFWHRRKGERPGQKH